MANTTNFGWETPDDTDLVKDGAAAIRTLGSAIDTSFVDLKGGTTNQVLAKNSNSDLDFKWVADATGISATIFDAKGDIIAATAADTADRLAVGTNGQVLTADSTTATGLKWATLGGSIWTLLNSGGTSLTGSSVTISGISNVEKLLILTSNASSNAAAGFSYNLRFNSDTGNNYNYWGTYAKYPTNYTPGEFLGSASTNNSSINLGISGDVAASEISGYIFVDGCKSTGIKTFWHTHGGTASTGNDHSVLSFGGYYNASAAITSVTLLSSSGNFDAGTVFVYGA